jgi:hypothetical protein
MIRGFVTPCVILSLATALPGLVLAQASTPKISLSPVAGTCNQAVTVTGEEFASNSQVEVWVGPDVGGTDVQYNTTTADADTSGSFQTTLAAFPGVCPADFSLKGLTFVAVGPAASGESTRVVANYSISGSIGSLPPTGSSGQAQAVRASDIFLFLAVAGTLLTCGGLAINARREDM